MTSQSMYTPPLSSRIWNLTSSKGHFPDGRFSGLSLLKLESFCPQMRVPSSHQEVPWGRGMAFKSWTEIAPIGLWPKIAIFDLFSLDLPTRLYIWSATTECGTGGVLTELQI